MNLTFLSKESYSYIAEMNEGIITLFFIKKKNSLLRSKEDQNFSSEREIEREREGQENTRMIWSNWTLPYWPFLLNHAMPHSDSGSYVFSSLTIHSLPVFIRRLFGPLRPLYDPTLKTVDWRLDWSLTSNCYSCRLLHTMGSVRRPLSVTCRISSGCKTETDRYSVGTYVYMI